MGFQRVVFPHLGLVFVSGAVALGSAVGMLVRRGDLTDTGTHAVRPRSNPIEKMSGSRQQALADARKLVRTFGSAPDPRRRAQAVLSELRHAEGWSPADAREIAAVEAWLREAPALSALEPRLRALLAALS